MELIIWTSVVFVIGWVLGNWSAIRTCSHLLNRLGVTSDQLKNLNVDAAPKEPEVIQIKIEQIGGSLYAYTVDTDSFLAQGSTAEDLVKGILQRLPVGARVICSREQGGDLIAQALKNG